MADNDDSDLGYLTALSRPQQHAWSSDQQKVRESYRKTMERGNVCFLPHGRSHRRANAHGPPFGPPMGAFPPAPAGFHQLGGQPANPGANGGPANGFRRLPGQNDHRGGGNPWYPLIEL